MSNIVSFFKNYGWDIEDILNSDHFLETVSKTSDLYSSDKTIYPKKQDIFKAFQLCSFEKTKVVILGQDPYHTPDAATGLAFGVKNSLKRPASLRNIFKELNSDLSILDTEHNTLQGWAKQGVLLLNSSLVVERGSPGSLFNIGWTNFTDSIIKHISDNKQRCVFILWGNYSISKEKLINRRKHLIISSSHPSPFSAHKGFFGSKPFSRANIFLYENGIAPIDWSDVDGIEKRKVDSVLCL